MFDSHCHLHDQRLRDITAQAVARAEQTGIRGLLLAGVDRESWPLQDALRRAFHSPHFAIGVAYGVHPQIIPELSLEQLPDQLTALREAAQGRLTCDGKTLLPPHAIGELGLDSYTEQTRAALPAQVTAFRDQLALARELDLPVVLHILRTHPESLRLLQQDGLPKSGGVIHSYSGSAEQARQYLALGLHLSFAGGVTRPNAPRLWAALQEVPDDRLLVETDAPDQTPWPHRPALCEPSFLPAVIDSVALIRKQSPQHIATITCRNAQHLFRLEPL